jgi:DNA-binding GntR family transcriptional regulator
LPDTYGHKEIAADLIEQISRGTLRPHTRLPGRVKLAAHYRVSETTVYRALSLLAYTGWVYSRQGKGVYVAERADNDAPGR